MKVRINGEDIDVADCSTVVGIMLEKKIPLGSVVVEYNKGILPPEMWATTQLKDNDAVEVIHFVGGG